MSDCDEGDVPFVKKSCRCGCIEAHGELCAACLEPWAPITRYPYDGLPDLFGPGRVGHETVDHPPHYGGADDPYETIKVLKAWLGRLGFEPYLAGCYFNVVKYLSRAGLKGDLLEDLKKARFYLDEMIRTIESWKGR